MGNCIKSNISDDDAKTTNETIEKKIINDNEAQSGSARARNNNRIKNKDKNNKEDKNKTEINWEEIKSSKEFINLQTQEFKDLKEFTFNGQNIVAKVDRVKDGDTISVVFYWRGELIKRSLRLEGLDAPEIHRCSELEKKAGLVAKNKLEEFIKKHSVLNSNIVYLELRKEEKYGRLMGRVMVNNICMNDWLIENKLAKPYTGKKKEPWSEKELEYILNH